MRGRWLRARGVFAFTFFFKPKTAYERRISDWSSDVCSSDLGEAGRNQGNSVEGIAGEREPRLSQIGERGDRRRDPADPDQRRFRKGCAELRRIGRAEVEQIGRAHV